MYRRHCIFTTIVFLFVFFSSLYFNLTLNTEFVSNLITFFSIIFGFYLTALSILFSSNFIKRLGNEEDPKITKQTKLQTLIAYFQWSVFTSILSIIILLISNLFGFADKDYISSYCITIYDLSFDLQNFITSLSLGLAIMNVIFMILLITIFFNAFIEESNSSH